MSDAAPRVIVIIGASSGIGLATAHRAADAGDHVVLAARGLASLERAAKECRERGAASVLVRPTDIADEASVQQLVAEVVAAYGRIDAVVPAAGVVAYGRFEEVPGHVFNHVVRTNLLGTANVARAVLPWMRQHDRGHLVIVGSLLGQMAPPFMGSYSVSKWGVRGLARILLIENRDRPGVHISYVSPGGVDTPIYYLAANYLGRVGRPPPPVARPEKVAAVILGLLDRPRARVHVGITNPLIVFGFATFPRLYDAIVTPMLEIAATDVRDRVDPHPGNVFLSADEGNRLRGDQGSVVTSIAAGIRAKLAGRMGGART